MQQDNPTLGEAVKAAHDSGSALPTEAGCDFGVDCRRGDIDSREDFEFGDKIRITKGRIVDTDRKQEGLAPDSPERKEAIDEDVAGVRGTLVSGTKYDPSIGEDRVFMETRQGGLLGVPVSRIERDAPSSRTGKVSISMANTRLTPDEEQVLVEYRKQRAADMKRFLEKVYGDAPHE